VTIVDRMNYLSPVANEVSWFQAVEKLLGIELTPRGKYVRTIFAELMRIQDHLLNVGTCALDLGAFTAFLYFFTQRERIYDLCELASGQRFHSSYMRVGGVMADVTDEWLDKARDFVRNFPRAHADVTRLLNKNRIFIERTKGVGYLSKEDAISLGCSGPVARASGVVRDMRKDEPYLAYNDFDFKVICAEGGDCYARYMVRMLEMQESIKILEQALENLPSGQVNADVGGKVTLPEKFEVYQSIEGLIHHFEQVMPNRGVPTPIDEVYGACESANGELGFYVVSDGTNRAYRARTRPPSFIHFGAFPLMMKGHQLSDVVAVLGSINIIAAELDR
jgi:NADH-quinone oxidoreductase subunit D